MRSARRWLPLLLLAAQSAWGQPAFVEVTPPTNLYFVNPENEDFWVDAVAPADVDGDGDLDLALLGFYVVYNESAEDRLGLTKRVTGVVLPLAVKPRR